jgi:FSR family fosmidomycin resistance protein-like MFS transporter
MNGEADTQGERYQVAASDEQAAPERFQTGRVVTMAVSHGLHDTYTAFLPPLLPRFISSLALSKAEAGLLNAFIQVPSLLQPAIGHLADRINLRFAVILAPAITATVMSLLGVAPGFALLSLLLLIAGCSSAGLHAVGPVMTGRLSGRNLGRGMSFWMVGGELGRTLGPVVVVTAIVHLTVNGMAWLMVAGWTASLILFFRVRAVSGRPEEVQARLPWRPALRRMRPVLLPLGSVIFLRAFMQAALTYYLPTFLTEAGANLWTAGASLTVLQAAGVAGALLGGSMSDRLGRRTMLLISMTGAPLFMFVFLATQGWIQLIVVICLGLLVISTTPVMMALVQESFPENRALANGTYMSMSFLIRAGVVILMGALSDQFGLRQMFAVSAVIMLGGIPLLLLLPNGRSSVKSGGDDIESSGDIGSGDIGSDDIGSFGKV